MLDHHFGWFITTIADPEQPRNADWVGVGISDDPAPLERTVQRLHERSAPRSE
jgi:hypothetical protein